MYTTDLLCDRASRLSKKKRYKLSRNIIFSCKKKFTVNTGLNSFDKGDIQSVYTTQDLEKWEQQLGITHRNPILPWEGC